MGLLLLAAAVLVAGGFAWWAARSSARARRLLQAAEGAAFGEDAVHRAEQVFDDVKERLGAELMRLLGEQADRERALREAEHGVDLQARIELLERRIKDFETTAVLLRRRLTEQDKQNGGPDGAG